MLIWKGFLNCFTQVFSLVYHLAGGTNYFYEPYIYPILDWSNPVRWKERDWDRIISKCLMSGQFWSCSPRHLLWWCSTACSLFSSRFGQLHWRNAEEKKQPMICCRKRKHLVLDLIKLLLIVNILYTYGSEVSCVHVEINKHPYLMVPTPLPPNECSLVLF